MADMLIKLYALPPRDRAAVPVDVVFRKPIGPEHEAVAAWVASHFGAGWSSEARVALNNRPCSLWLATRGANLIGFVCHDATALGFIGPIGVIDGARNGGVGAALLRAALDDMRATGYGYAIAGAVGPMDFFRRVAAAVEISDSTPGLYRDRLRAEP
jgi:GNAT superfamily N-acetyltransferase